MKKTLTLTLREFVDISDFNNIKVTVLGEEKFTASATDIWFGKDYEEYLDRSITRIQQTYDNGIIVSLTAF